MIFTVNCKNVNNKYFFYLLIYIMISKKYNIICCIYKANKYNENKYQELFTNIFEQDNDNDNKTMLHYAIANNNLGIIKLLFEKNPEMIIPENLEITDNNNKSILHYAVEYNYTEIFVFLLFRMTHIYSKSLIKLLQYIKNKDNNNKNILYYAIRNKNINIFKSIINNINFIITQNTKQNTNIISINSGDLSLTVEDNPVDILYYVISNYSNDEYNQFIKPLRTYITLNNFNPLNIELKEKKTMIHYIVEHNNYKSLFKSLELKLSNEKYDYNIQDSYGNTPLHYIIKNNVKDSLTDCFIDNHKSINLKIQNNEKKTPFEYLLSNYNNNIQMIQLLSVTSSKFTAINCNIEDVTDNNQNLLHKAIIYNDIDVIKSFKDKILSHNFNKVDNYNKTPIDYALEKIKCYDIELIILFTRILINNKIINYEFDKTIKIFLLNKLLINYIDSNNTILINMINQILLYLPDKKNINFVHNDKYNLLLNTIKKKDIQLIKILLDINIQNSIPNNKLYNIFELAIDSECILKELVNLNFNLMYIVNNNCESIVYRIITPTLFNSIDNLIILKSILFLDNFNINKKYDSGYTILHLAIIIPESIFDIKQFLILILLNKNIDINIKDNDGYTFLYYAFQKNNRQLIELLFNNIENIYDDYIYDDYIYNDYKEQIKSITFTHINGCTNILTKYNTIHFHFLDGYIRNDLGNLIDNNINILNKYIDIDKTEIYVCKQNNKYIFTYYYILNNNVNILLFKNLNNNHIKYTYLVYNESTYKEFIYNNITTIQKLFKYCIFQEDHDEHSTSILIFEKKNKLYLLFFNSGMGIEKHENIVINQDKLFLPYIGIQICNDINNKSTYLKSINNIFKIFLISNIYTQIEEIIKVCYEINQPDSVILKYNQSIIDILNQILITGDTIICFPKFIQYNGIQYDLYELYKYMVDKKHNFNYDQNKNIKLIYNYYEYILEFIKLNIQNCIFQEFKLSNINNLANTDFNNKKLKFNFKLPIFIEDKIKLHKSNDNLYIYSQESSSCSWFVMYWPLIFYNIFNNNIDNYYKIIENITNKYHDILCNVIFTKDNFDKLYINDYSSYLYMNKLYNKYIDLNVLKSSLINRQYIDIYQIPINIKYDSNLIYKKKKLLLYDENDIIIFK